MHVTDLARLRRYRFGSSSSSLPTPLRLSHVALKYREVRKFLAGAFFVSSGILWYLWVTDTSLPIVLPYAGTISVETPNISGQRAIVHFILFVLCLYFGFFSKKEENAKN